MPDKVHAQAYRALFPDLYTRARLPGEAAIKALQMPNMRVMGPFWSLGVVVEEIETLPGTDLGPNAMRHLRLLQDAAKSVPDQGTIGSGDDPLQGMHQPQILRMRFGAFFSYDADKLGTYFPSTTDDSKYPGASKLSILAVDTLHENMKDFPAHVPVVTGAAAASNQRDIVVAALAEMPPTKPSNGTHLCAMQMVSGQIEMSPSLDYLKQVRSELVLSSKALDELPLEDMRNKVYALPDGFALYGVVPLPGIAAPVAGWFKVTFNCQSPQEDLTPILTPWTEGPSIELTTTGAQNWGEALAHLDQKIFATDPINGAHWLSLNRNAPLSPSDFVWELDKLTATTFLAHRDPPMDHRVLLRTDALNVQLRYKPTSEAPQSVLSLKPDGFALTEVGGAPVITDVTPDSVAVGELTSVYRYRREPGEGETRERLAINPGSSVELALPVAETAAKIRAAQDMEAPELAETPAYPLSAKDNPSGLLWTFLAVEQGWLHVPLPNATLSQLNRFVGPPEDTAPMAAPEAPESWTTGALGYQNQAGVAGFDAGSRNWAITLTDVESADLRLEFSSSGPGLAAADIDLKGGALSAFGAMEVTPFRQTSERLLPDHRERALTSVGLTAVSPSLLRGVEARVWNDDETARALRLSLQLEDLVFTPSAQKDDTPAGVAVQGEVTLAVEMRHDGQTVFADERRPWLWCRQDSLPSVQTRPLALAGAAVNTPSGSRELAPLRTADAATDVQRYTLNGALDMRRSVPRLASSEAWEHPTQDLDWLDEIGMAYLTLPSVTAFPGQSDTKDKARLSFDEFAWRGDVQVSTEFTFRHDLAVLDDVYAVASLPIEAPKDDEATAAEPKPAPSTFRPMPSNGPGGDSDTKDSAWLAAWQGKARSTALAATSGRAMIHINGGTTELVGLTGSYAVDVKVKPPQQSVIVEQLSEEDGETAKLDPTPFGLVSVGGYDLTFEEPDSKEIRLGLPDESDLVARFANLPNGGPGPLDFGTLAISSDPNDPLTDQRGLTMAPAALSGGLVFRTIAKEGKEFRLVTCSDPFKGRDEAKDLSLWFADVPLNATGTEFASEAKLDPNNPDWAKRPVNAGSFRNAALQGYRWAFDTKNTDTDGPLICKGLAIVPLALADLQLSGSDTEASPNIVNRFEIEARPVLDVTGGGKTPPPSQQIDEIRGSDGAIKVIASLNADRSFDVAFADPDQFQGPDDAPYVARWPLALQSGLQTQAPVLTLSRWPTDKLPAKSNAQISFSLAGQSKSVEAKARFDAARKTLTAKAELNKPKAAGFSGVWLAEVAVELGPGTRHALAPLSAIVTLNVDISRDDWTLACTLTKDILDPSATWSVREGVLQAAGLPAVNIEAQEDEDGHAQVVFDGTGLHLKWHLPFTGEEGRVNIWDAFELQSGSGILSAALEAPSDDKDTAFKARDAQLEAQAGLITCVADLGGQTLTLARKGAAPRFGLYGTLALENLFQWPELGEIDLSGGDWLSLELAAGTPTNMRHNAEIVFEGQPIASITDGSSWVIAAQVKHTLSKVIQTALGEDRDVFARWAIYQSVAFRRISDLRSASGSEDGLERAPLSVLGVRRGPELNIDDLRASEYVFHQDIARHGAASGLLRDRLATHLPKTGLQVDLSAHHHLNWAAPGQEDTLWAQLALPHLSVLTPDTPWVAPPDVTSVMRMPPSEALKLHVHSSGVAAHTKGVSRPDLADLDAIQAAYERAIDPVRNSASEAPAAALGFDLNAPIEDQIGGHPIVQSLAVLEAEDSSLSLLGTHYPALAQALSLQHLQQLGLSDRPVAYGFTLSTDRLALVLGDKEYSGDRMARNLRMMSDRWEAHLVPGPGLDQTSETQTAKSRALSLWAARRGGQGLETIAQAALQTASAQSQVADLAWAEQTLLRLAPWVEHGVLVWENFSDGGDIASRKYALVPPPGAPRVGRRPPRPGASRPREAISLGRRRSPEPQRVPLPVVSDDAALPKRLNAGFMPRASDAALWTSDPGVVPGGPTSGLRLSSTASQIHWDLAGGSYLGPAEKVARANAETRVGVRLQERADVAFREASPWAPKDGGKARLTTALPEGYEAELPSGLSPVVHPPRRARPSVETGREDETLVTQQAVVPAFSITARLSDRPGVWSENRLGLVGTVERKTGLSASMVPLTLRSPRPPTLGINDRPRASSHEKPHVSVRPNPSLVLHGPRAARAGVALAPEGLDRSPRSRHARIFEIVSPHRGLIEPGWDGSLGFDEIDGPVPDAFWKVEKAEAWLQGKRYDGQFSENTDIAQGIQQFARLDENGAEMSLQRAAAAVPPGTAVDVLIEVDHNKLKRQLRMQLLTMGEARGLAEAPVYVRFDDPEYNDRLTGTANLTFEPAPVDTPTEFVFAADRNDLRPDDRVDIILGLRPVLSEDGGPGEAVFEPSGAWASLPKRASDPINAERLVGLRIERRRVVDGTPQRDDLVLRDPKLPALRNPMLFKLKDRDTSLPYALNMGDLLEWREEDVVVPPANGNALMPEDQVTLTCLVKESDGTWAKLAALSFDVVDAPLFPPNPSQFALLEMTDPEGDADVAVPLFAPSPVPVVIELVDPKDMLDGIVRRRALYQWRFFAEQKPNTYYALQKIAFNGATYLESDLAEGWQRVASVP